MFFFLLYSYSWTIFGLILIGSDINVFVIHHQVQIECNDPNVFIMFNTDHIHYFDGNWNILQLYLRIISNSLCTFAYIYEIVYNNWIGSEQEIILLPQNFIEYIGTSTV